MTSDLPPAVPSPPPEDPSRAPTPDTSEFELSLAALIMLRGSPLIEALANHVPGSRDHADATGSYALAAAAAMGFDRRHAEAVRETARLHEIGLVYAPSGALAKPRNELTDTERDAVERHHEAGFRLALGAGIPDRACEWILRVGERYDGRGPGQRAGHGIPVEARIIAAACACDSALADPEAGGDSQERVASAVTRLREQAGRELDPDVVEALASMLARSAA